MTDDHRSQTGCSDQTLVTPKVTYQARKGVPGQDIIRLMMHDHGAQAEGL